MSEKNTVFIAVKRTDESLARLGMNRDTYDFSIASEVRKELESLAVKVYIKDLGTQCSEEDRRALQAARMLIVIATKEMHLRASQKIVGFFGAGSRTKRIVYLCAENIGEMRSNSFQINDDNASLETEVYELSPTNSLPLFAKSICTYLNTDGEDKKTMTVHGLLKISRSIPPAAEKATERRWLSDALDKWLKNSRNRNIFWLCGEHGSGKTIFIGNYCSNLKNCLGKGIYYCHCSSRETQNIERMIRAIAYELSVSIPGYAQAIYDIVTNERFQNIDADALFSALLIAPFADHPEICPVRGKFVFVIDGIDELKTGKIDALTPFLTLLCSYAQKLPRFIYLIITSPAIDIISNTMKRLSVRTIDLAEDKYLSYKKSDAERFLRTELDELGIPYSDDDIQIILRKAEWNFDYLHYFIEQCEDEGNKKLPPLDQLPDGLPAMFELDFSNRFSDDFYNSKVKPILQILAAAYEPFSVDDLTQVLSANMNDVQTIIKGQLRQFLRLPNENEQSEIVSLYNMSFEIWLTKKKHKYCVDTDLGANAIVDWFRTKEGQFYKNQYLQKYGLLHVLKQGRHEIIENLIVGAEEDDFEKLKEELGILFISDGTNQVDVISELMHIYRDSYDKTVRIRDILVYTYRYVLKRKGKDFPGLSDISALLNQKNEKIRARLLTGEGISVYDEAKKYFKETIEQASEITKGNEGNSWWNLRMLGVSYNRLANLENRAGHVDEACTQYENGKDCFDKAIGILSADVNLANAFREDYEILERDEAIINERLGDLSFKQKCFEKAVHYYKAYYDACNQALERKRTLNSKWDLSISLLRLGDARRYLGELKEAKENYRDALDLRRDILQHMRSDCMDILSNGNRNYYKDFACPEKAHVYGWPVDDVPRESRDIEPVRDIALCYVRLGDLAFSLDCVEASEFYYDIFHKLCERNNADVRTRATEYDLEISRQRKNRIRGREFV